MSKYTTEVRFICESLTGHDDSTGYDDIDSIIQDAIPLIFSFDFPIFDEEYRNVLCTKILRHYYTREIGLETYGLWKLKLQTKLNEIMPYYNKLYESELYKYNPLHDVDMTTTNVGQKTGERTDVQNDDRTNTFSGSRTSENEQTNVASNENVRNSDSQDRDMYSDTPQGSLTGVDTNAYLTNFRKILGTNNTTDKGNATDVAQGKQTTSDQNTESSTGRNTSIGKTNNTEDYVMHVVGKSAGANYAKMIKDFRDNLLNIDMDIIRDLGELFMLLW